MFLNKRLIDLNNDRTSSDRFLKLKHQVYQNLNFVLKNAAIGFLPNGDLIQISLGDHKIYKYCFTDKPKNTVPWKYSQINDIKIPERLNDKVRHFMYQTKLFLFVIGSKMLQFDLFTMNLERKYQEFPNVVARNQTLLATSTNRDKTCVYSMENGMLIYKCEYYFSIHTVYLIW
ncbi:hypothetical protein GLOIN_2v1784920 [Rhizophagus clarus]|uniref:Uncharacterized protein n=1 Tax=Rhizophagus clarus TaxID=94130 RepID=A0A8H3KUA7_9GLOM|nr:hypothetical protein GLOIN_2v1784920 [Rhizophagus clarus]